MKEEGVGKINIEWCEIFVFVLLRFQDVGSQVYIFLFYFRENFGGFFFREMNGFKSTYFQIIIYGVIFYIVKFLI